jgi:hypothetical protein
VSGSGFFFGQKKRYFELGTSMNRLTRLLSLFRFSGGPAAQDLWSSPGLEPMKKSGSLLMYSLRMILLYL